MNSGDATLHTDSVSVLVPVDPAKNGNFVHAHGEPKRVLESVTFRLLQNSAQPYRMVRSVSVRIMSPLL